jgi:hypothetical protein
MTRNPSSTSESSTRIMTASRVSQLGTSNNFYANKRISIDCLPADDEATVESGIMANASTLGGFGGDSIWSSYWGCADNLNAGGSANVYSGGNNTQSCIPTYSTLTVNMRSSTTI